MIPNNSDQPKNSDRYQESASMISELRAHAEVCQGSLPLGGCGLTVGDILRRKAARHAKEKALSQPPVKFFSIETVETGK